MGVRVVFDCMVFLQAVTNEAGPASACLRLVDEGWLALHVSGEVLAEVRDVLGRDKIRRKFPSLTDSRIESFLQAVREKTVMHDEVPRVLSHARDPDDEPYLNLALAADARYLVSRDKDLLDLMADATFRGQHPRLAVVDPPALLRELTPLPPGSLA